MRKIIQIAFEPYENVHGSIDSFLNALCDDGTVWVLHEDNGWFRRYMPPIPQNDEGESKENQV